MVDKRLYFPEKNNALYFLFDLQSEYRKDPALEEKKVEIFKELNGKIKGHLAEKEFEPIYLAASVINTYFPDKKNTKLLKKATQQLHKNVEPIKWIFVKGGSYQMGDFEKKTILPHTVKLNTFRMSETPVTNYQFCKFLNEMGNMIEFGQTAVKTDSPYSRINYERGVYSVKEPYDAFPVYEVSWYGAQKFCEWVGGRLPTEAEWEYAARSRGLNYLYATGKKLDRKKANFLVYENDSRWHSLSPVKSFKPNKIGLYEMSGNILEWCSDWFDSNYYQNSPEENPTGPARGEMKVVRGGAWCFSKEQAVTFYRSAVKPSTRNNFTGFRVVLPV
jgi:formylglycine-generating enzyme required for sulfatase activity